MKILYPNVAYSDIPRLVQEGVIKVGTRVKACTESEGKIGTIKEIGNEGFYLQCENRVNNSLYEFPWFLDILSDEEEEGVLTHSEIGKGVKSKTLSFDEPLTKEVVGRVIVNGEEKRMIMEVGGTGNVFLPSIVLSPVIPSDSWWSRQQAKNAGWYFESSPEEITIEEAEKLTGKTIKR
jgi:hypothetical protein